MAAPQITIGIAGGSGAGKSTFIAELCEQLPCSSSVLRMDDYYRDLSELSADERGQVNFDTLEAIDVELMRTSVRDLKSGNPIETPIYNFSTHAREPGGKKLVPGQVLLVDGVMLLACDELRQELDLTIFIDVPPDERLVRRIQRDQADRGRSLESILNQWQTSVKPGFETLVVPSLPHADLVLQSQDFSRVAKTLAKLVAISPE
ncbi:MAG: uridine kinase [Planctomycetota bacterium]